MNTEFHYYVTGIVANAAGFPEQEAKTIAASSEFVDENDVQIKVRDESKEVVYQNYISQTMNILKPKQKLMRIYPAFHFVPGQASDKRARRRDGKMHLLNTTPDNEIANLLLDKAFDASEDTRLYRIGIASHAYADTWAHQNFVGWYDYFNSVGLNIKPDIGHSDAEHHPDWVAHRWEDCRLLEEEVDNTERYLEATEKLYHKFKTFNENRLKRNVNLTWEELYGKLVRGFGTSFSGSHNEYHEDRLNFWRKQASWLGDFDERVWLEDAMQIKVRGFKDSKEGILSTFTLIKDEFFWKDPAQKERTDWYRFQEAVKEHQSYAIALLDPIFKDTGFDLYAI